MTFALTDELTDKIISAMDNQEQKFLVDALAVDLVSYDSVITDSVLEKEKSSLEPKTKTEAKPETEIEAKIVDKIEDKIEAKAKAKTKIEARLNDNYYELPDWKPADGFTVRENFVNNLHSPLAREELQVVLHSGRGVFKNFRNVLKKYPEIDKRWHIYKHRIMSARINEWYNSLREIWGLEKLDQFSESEESIVFDDFSFEDYDSESQDSMSKNEILFNIRAEYLGCEPDNTDIPYEVNSALQKLLISQFEKTDYKKHTGFICHSLSDDFAGCITAAPIFDNQENIMVLTSLFVPENFRGLGIATELITRLFSKLQKMHKSQDTQQKKQSEGTTWILMPNSITPELLEPLLTRLGFEKIRFGYMAEIR